MTERWKVVVADYDYGDLDIERGILEPIGAKVVGLQAKHEEDLIPEVVDCDAVINQYARVGLAAIRAMTRCKVIARYGIGVDIVDVEAATKHGILVTNVRDYCTEEVADHAILTLFDCPICSDGLGCKGSIYVSPLKSLIAGTDSQEGTWKSAA